MFFKLIKVYLLVSKLYIYQNARCNNKKRVPGIFLLGGKGGRCVGLTTLPPSCADCLEIWEPQTFWNPLGLSRPVMVLLYLYRLWSSKMFSVNALHYSSAAWSPISLLHADLNYWGYRGGTVVKVLCYKSEGRWFYPRWCHWNFSLT